MLALLVQTGAALEIGHTTVNSKLGEPLDATVRVIPGPEERIDATCLSLVRKAGPAETGHVLINDVALSQESGSGSIHITTATPVTQSAITLALKAECSSGPAVVRMVNLHVNPPPQSVTRVSSAARPGSTFTVRPGDSIYKLARLIYPHNEIAVRNLARAIVMTNPALFPDGHARPLQIGERLIIPDLRTVNQIVAASAPTETGTQRRTSGRAHVGPMRKLHTAQPQSTTESVKNPPATRTKRPDKSESSDKTPGYKVLASGKLRLKLSTDLDLGGAAVQTKAKSAAKRPPPEAVAPAEIAETKASLELSMIASRIDRLRVLQDELNARVARLEINAAALQKVFARNEAPQRAPTPAVSPRAASKTIPPTPPHSAVNNRRSMLLQYQWFIVGGLAIVLLLAGFMLARMFRNRKDMSQHRRRIDAMLEEARTAATPLLGNEPRLPEYEAPAFARSASTGEDEDVTDYASDEAIPPIISDEIAPAVDETEPVKDHWHGAGATETLSSESDEVPIWLRTEMDKAMDTTRSMFSDVDRFITLGRIENAISLLEFQIKRNPADRNAWIKLMAVYRDRGLDDDFGRTYAAFREQFGDKPGY